jgi:hypothetical protein
MMYDLDRLKMDDKMASLNLVSSVRALCFLRFALTVKYCDIYKRKKVKSKRHLYEEIPK